MKKIIVGVSASIAAYKAAELVRGLIQQGLEVQVVMTEHAKDFVTPLTFQALSGKPVLSSWNAAESQAGMDHIGLARWADAIVCAPASADFMARLAHGLANNLLTTLCLVTKAPIYIAPAMNPDMWAHPATQTNYETLKHRNVYFLGPAQGNHACGETGIGRMLEPNSIIEHLLSNTFPASLKNHRVLITAGPTQEALDPVRFLSNHSTGKMGFALAEAAYKAGAEVVVIAGPTSHSLAPHIQSAIQYIQVNTAEEMLKQVLRYAHFATIFIAAAAVADYQVSHISEHKIKKQNADELQLTLKPTPDILAKVASLSPAPFTVGFALETQNLEANAEKKLKDKNIDMIVANALSSNTGFGSDTNAVTVLYQDGKSETIPLMSKKALADKLIERIAQQFRVLRGEESLELS